MLTRRIICDNEKEEVLWKMSLIISGILLCSLICCESREELFKHTREVRKRLFGFEIPFAFSVAEILTCAVLFSVSAQRELRSLIEGFVIAGFAHIGGNFLTNFWFSVEHKHSFSSGYLEPVVMLFILKICTGREIGVKLFGYLSLIATGASFSSGNFSALFGYTKRPLLLFLVGYFMSLRNTVFSHLISETVTLKIRNKTLVPFAFTVIFGLLVLSLALPSDLVFPMIFYVVATLSSVAVLLLTVLLMRYCHVTVLPVVSVWVQLTNNMVCFTNDYIQSLSIALVGVAILMIGTYAYGRYMSENDKISVSGQFPVGQNEMYTRMEFLLFAGSIVGLLLYVLHPRVSDRDLKALRYVGLENVMRKLLSSKHPA